MSTEGDGPASPGVAQRTPANRRGMIGWAMFDWANSAFTTLIITFVFAAYFSQGIVGDNIRGQALWGYVAGFSSLLVAILSPILGAIADSGGPRKRWIFVFTVMCVVATALLWFAKPTSDAIPLAMILVVIASVGFEFGIVFNNAMLGDLAPPDRIGRWSGWAWGSGYFGGLVALVVMLVGFVQTETPWFGIGKEEAANIRVVGPLVAIWFAIFVIPFFVFTPDRPASAEPTGALIRKGFRDLGHTLGNLRQHGNVVRFMMARMLYNDGVVTIFAIGGVYAAGRFGMATSELIQFGILLNVTAGLGAFGFAWIDDWQGSKKAIAFAIIGLIVAVTGAVSAPTVNWFWGFGAVLGIFVGPVQAASRSFMTHLAPPELRTEFFGLYALSGKATAFFGPVAVALVTTASGSQSIGVATLIIFFVAGLALLWTVKEPERCPPTSED